MKRIAPDAQIIDITHGIPATSILQGALVLANTVGFMPVGVHLAIVDPGVGGPRRPLALRDTEGRVYVGPDNGLLLPAASRMRDRGRIRAGEPRRTRSTPSRGRSTDATCSLLQRPISRPVSRSRSWARRSTRRLSSVSISPSPSSRTTPSRATLLYVDSFGNIALNLDRDDVEALGIVSGTRVELELAGERYYAVMARTFADARAGRRDPLRGQLQEHVARDLARERCPDAARIARAGHPDHDRELITRRAAVDLAHGRAASICAARLQQERVAGRRADRLHADRQARLRSSGAEATSRAVR